MTVARFPRTPTVGEMFEADAPDLAARTLRALRAALGEQEARARWNAPGSDDALAELVDDAGAFLEQEAAESLARAACLNELCEVLAPVWKDYPAATVGEAATIAGVDLGADRWAAIRGGAA